MNVEKAQELDNRANISIALVEAFEIEELAQAYIEQAEELDKLYKANELNAEADMVLNGMMDKLVAENTMLRAVLNDS